MNAMSRGLSWLLAGGDVRDNPARVAPPDEPRRISRFGLKGRPPIKFDGLSHDKQWAQIGEYLRRNPSQDGLLGEAVTFHRFNSAIVAARCANDHEVANRLTEAAQREYLGAVIQAEWDAEAARS